MLPRDHLDGGLRPRTVIELASVIGYRELPTTDPDELAKWFTAAFSRANMVASRRGSPTLGRRHR